MEDQRQLPKTPACEMFTGWIIRYEMTQILELANFASSINASAGN